MIAALLLLLWANNPSFDDALRAGLTALSGNDLAAAQMQLELAAKLQPARAEAWLGLAQTYLRQRRRDAADAAASRAEGLKPANPGILHGLSLYYSETGNYGKAAECEARYAGAAPGDPDALPRAAALYLQAKQPERAIGLANEALRREDRADVHLLLGKAYAAAGRSADSVAELRAAIRLRPYEEAYYFELGQEQLQLQNFQAALATLDTGVKLFDKSAQLVLARGVALYALRRFPEAIDAFLRTIQLAPEVAQPYVFLGRMLDVSESRLPVITQVFAARYSARPDDASSCLLYAKALRAGSGDPARIESLLRKSIALDGSNWEAHFELGIALELRRAYDEAAKELERAIGLNPSDAAAHYRLARIYDRLGRPQDAARQREIHARLAAGAKTEGSGVK